MTKTKTKYHLRICQSIFKDNTYSIYAVPNFNNNMEYQIIGRIETIDQARVIAEFIWDTIGNQILIQKEPEIIKDRELDLNVIIAKKHQKNRKMPSRKTLRKILKKADYLEKFKAQRKIVIDLDKQNAGER